MRAVAFLLVLSIPLFSFSLSWIHVSMSYHPEAQVVNGTKLYVLVPRVKALLGPALGLQYTVPSLICTNTKAYVNVVADIARGEDQTYASYYINGNGTTYCVPFNFNTLKQGSGALEALKLTWNLIKLSMGNPTGLFGILSAILKPELEGVYLNVYVQNEHGKAYLSHYLYQRKVDETLRCLKVIPEEVPFVPGMYYNVTFVNNCNSTLHLKLSLDIKLARDLVLGYVNLDPGSSITIRLHVPSYFGDKESYARDVKVDVCDESCKNVYAIPVYDYIRFFVAIPDNYQVHWYQGGEEVQVLEPGEAKVCFNLTKVHPDIKVGTVVTFMIIQNRRLLPDKVTAMKTVSVNSFDDFNVCLPFYASSGITVRGYKLVLEVGEATYTLSEIGMVG